MDSCIYLFLFFYQFIVKIMIIKTLKIIKWYVSFILHVVLLELELWLSWFSAKR